MTLDVEAGNAEWLTIVEQQQLELEQLRRRVSAPPSVVTPGRARCSSSRSSLHQEEADDDAGSVRSAFSLHSPVPEPQALDLPRFAKLCDDVEAAQAQLTKKDVEMQQLRAREAHALREWRLVEDALRAQQATTRQLTSQLARERDSMQQAVERAAQAMVRSDAACSELAHVRRALASLEDELQRRDASARDLECRNTQDREDSAALRQRLVDLELVVRSKNADVEHLRGQLRVVEEDTERCQHMEEQLRAATTKIQAQDTLLHSQTAQMEKLQAVAVRYDQENTRLHGELEAEQLRAVTQATQQVASNVVLQEVVEHQQGEIAMLQERRLELKECLAMAGEEAAALMSWRRLARGRLVRQEALLREQDEGYQRLAKEAKYLECSRRQAISELMLTKKQFPQIRDIFQAVESELLHLNKTVSTCRKREANVSRVMKEYARRNRSLQDAVEKTKAKLGQVSQSLRRSERRKSEVVHESAKLKRGLIVERCQREDLLHQCIQLEKCLTNVQQAASVSVDRARAVEKENAVLKTAVTEISAYSKELMASQESLQQELLQLEVDGHREPHVYG